MMEALRIYTKLIKIGFKSMLQFRADFIMGLLGILGMNAINLVAISVILLRFQELGGWTIWEIVFLYGIWMIGNSIFSLLFFHVFALEYYIIEGRFDKFLVRPLSPFLQFMGDEVDIMGIPDLIFGVTVTTLAMANLGITFTPIQWLFLLVMLACAPLIELGIILALSSVAFWTGRSEALAEAAFQINWNLTQQYPLDMFGRGFRVLVTLFIPVAFLNYYPARWLLGKTVPGDPQYFLSFLSPLAAVVLLGIAAIVWQRGVRQYTSPGN